MRTALLRAAAVVAIAALPLAVNAAPKPFPALNGWDHTPPKGTAGRVTEQYKKGDQIITVLSDDQLSYDTMVDAVKKNISTNNLKPTMDKDISCGGRKAHEVEMMLGITIYHQLIINDNPGVTKITYARGEDQKAATDAMAALSGYCS